MRKYFYIAALFVICLSTSVFADRPKRIISLKPNITELLFEIGAGDQVVGVTTWCNKPEAAKKLPKVADYLKPNVEMIVALKPDLVVTSTENSVKAPIDVIEKMGIPVLLIPFRGIDDLLNSAKKLGEATEHLDGAAAFIHKVKGLVEGHPPRAEGTKDEGRKTLIIVGKHPLVAAGPKTFLSEIVRLAGGTNIIQSQIPYPHVNMELVLAGDPEVVIDFSMGSETETKASLKAWKKYPIRAAKDDRIYALDISDFRIGPGIVDQVATVRKILNGETN